MTYLLQKSNIITTVVKFYQNTFYVFYRHSVFQSKARICLTFSQIQPQNMLKISKNIQKSKFHDLIHAWGEGVGREFQNQEFFKFVDFYIAKNLG